MIPPRGTSRNEWDGAALARRFPGIAGELPRIRFTELPTPVRPLERLAAERGKAGSLWIKCDDRTGPFYGGNKPRKLEFLLADAGRRNASAVLTFGGIGTNHGLATTIHARSAGMETILILSPQPVTEHVRRNLLLHHAYGTRLYLARSPAAARIRATLLRLLSKGSLYTIPTGGSTPLGAIGFVNAALELAEQVRNGELPEPDDVFIPLGSGGTQAGLVAGFRLAGMRTRVVGVLVTDTLAPSRNGLARMAAGAVRILHRIDPSVPSSAPEPKDFHILTGHLGDGYGSPTEEAVRATRLIADLEGIRLETTYSAKCLAAVLVCMEQEEFRNRNILFWNTFSSVDPAERLERLPDFRELPPAFHRFFTAG